jgi:glycosyltransferase involved in cell wall biosynthesis
MSPVVSVLFPVLDDASDVADALDSVLEQKVELEVIAVDGGSTDGTLDILEEYVERDERVELVHQQSGPLARALNLGLDRARGNYVARQDADDRSLSGRFETQRRFLETEPEIDVVGTGSRILLPNGTETEYRPTDEVSDTLPSHNPIIHGSVMARRSALEAVGGYDERFVDAEDYDLWMRLTDSGRRVVNIEDILYEHRSGEQHISLEARKRRTLYGIIAATPRRRKEAILSALEETDSEDPNQIYERLNASGRATYHCRMCRSYLRRREGTQARDAAVSALWCEPLSPKTVSHGLLTALPVSVGGLVVERMSKF